MTTNMAALSCGTPAARLVPHFSPLLRLSLRLSGEHAKAGDKQEARDGDVGNERGVRKSLARPSRFSRA